MVFFFHLTPKLLVAMLNYFFCFESGLTKAVGAISSDSTKVSGFCVDENSFPLVSTL